MTKAQKKIIKNYKREIRKLLPIFTKNENIFSMIYLFLSKIMLLQTKVFPKTHL
ncbi:hypothetical protein HMPREF9477_00352 [Lachnospiraceae bacterium 2_1_46FAA]|nr:hypothetical protein HMPREF9477_00352 [Lachnospiraceae bacterium 2_1_46FAA]